MILQALADYYEALLRDGKVAGRGWCQARTTFALNLNPDGSLKGVITLKEEKERGKEEKEGKGEGEKSPDPGGCASDGTGSVLPGKGGGSGEAGTCPAQA